MSGLFRPTEIIHRQRAVMVVLILVPPGLHRHFRVELKGMAGCPVPVYVFAYTESSRSLEMNK